MTNTRSNFCLAWHLLQPSGCLVSLLLALMATCHADEPGTGTHSAVERYVRGDTVLVGWVDIAELDLDSLQLFFDQIDAGTFPGLSPQLHENRNALVKLGVTRIYWVASLPEAMAGPQALIIPVPEDRADGVALVIQGTLAADQSVTVAGEIVIAGNDVVVGDLQQRVASANESLLRRLRSIDSPSGVIAAIAPEAMRALVSVARSQASSNTLDRDLIELLPDVQAVALHGHLPPVKALFQIDLNSEAAASDLADLLNNWSAQVLGDDSTSVQLTARDSTVVLESNSIGQSTTVMKALWKLTQPAREQSLRVLVKNKLKQLGLAMHNFHDRYLQFPAQKLVDETGKPLLSWRVLILPFLDQQTLYDEFHLDEPWDSEHNSKLIHRLPDVFASSPKGATPAAAGKTRFVVLLVKNSVFGQPGTGVRIRDIRDGTSNTIMVLQTTEENAVIWTKPEDLLLTDVENLFPAIAGNAPEFVCTFCDGSVRYLAREIKEATLRALLTINGEEIIELP